MKTFDIYAGLIAIYCVIWFLQMVVGSNVMGHGSNSIVDMYLYLLLILSLIIFIWSGIFLLNNFSKNGFCNSLKTQNGKIFLLSFGFLTFSLIQFSAIRLMMDSSIAKMQSQTVQTQK